MILHLLVLLHNIKRMVFDIGFVILYIFYPPTLSNHFPWAELPTQIFFEEHREKTLCQLLFKAASAYDVLLGAFVRSVAFQTG